MLLERAIDIIILGILVVVLIRDPSNFTKGAVLVAIVLLALGWVMAWYRRK
jgi:hypothetical protein